MSFAAWTINWDCDPVEKNRDLRGIGTEDISRFEIRSKEISISTNAS